jgi:hypothetical protein
MVSRLTCAWGRWGTYLEFCCALVGCGIGASHVLVAKCGAAAFVGLVFTLDAGLTGAGAKQKAGGRYGGVEQIEWVSHGHSLQFGLAQPVTVSVCQQ